MLNETKVLQFCIKKSICNTNVIITHLINKKTLRKITNIIVVIGHRNHSKFLGIMLSLCKL